MTLLASLIVGVMVGIAIILLSFLVIGKFTMESGASPILLVFVTFFALTIGNLLYSWIVSYIFPHIYGRHRTNLAQIVIASILLYVLFIPVYSVISWVSTETRIILVAFSTHVVINAFVLTLVMGLISRYRYALLTLYASIIALLITAMVVIVLQSSLSRSENALFILMGLPIMAYTLSASVSTLLSWIYYRVYISTGSDPLGSVFARIEEEEKEIESAATAELTKF
jgi:hypothetical protein